MDVHQSIDITAPPEHVWPLLVEPDKVKQWYVTLEDFEYVDGDRGGLGRRVHVVEHATGSTLRVDFETTRWVENRGLALHMTSGNMVKTYDQSWDLEPTPTGCRFTFDEHVELPFGPLGRVIGALGRRTSERHVTEMLSKLKALAET